ncbi:hydroxymethylglutaryl-CoA reductase [Candidatus Riflebacteria bacterium]
MEEEKKDNNSIDELDLQNVPELFDVRFSHRSGSYAGILRNIGKDYIVLELPAQDVQWQQTEQLKVLEVFFNRNLVYRGPASIKDWELSEDGSRCSMNIFWEAVDGFKISLPELYKAIRDELEARTVVLEGQVDLPQLARAEKIPARKSYEEADIKERLDWICSRTGVSGEALGSHSMDPLLLRGNIENMIGAVQVPVGLAGPLLINGHHAKGYFFVPIATSEGALLASIARGAYVFSLCGGINVSVLRQQMVRAPQFNFSSTGGALRFKNWIVKNFRKVKEEAERFSRRAKLVFLDTYVLGKAVHVRFCYRTGDAAGQNMCTICTWGASKYVAAQLQKDPTIGFENYVLEGNFAGDKKVNMFNFIHGRGISIVADAFVSKRVMKRFLRITPENMVKAMTQSLHGATATGQIGNTANFANVIAGIFTACGQDIACVHESSSGQLFFEATDEGFYMGCRIPNIVIGTVGGGTALPAQKECLKILGCYGSGKVGRLAEIIGACCLALDLSTCAALVEDTFAQAHDSLGRNRPTS